MTDEVHKGLDGVVVDESAIGRVDGEQGDLYYAGYHIDDLVTHASYEEVLHLLISGELPDADELADIRATLHEESQVPDTVLDLIREVADDSTPMDLLRTCVSLLASFDDDPDSWDDPEKKALSIIAKTPTIVAAHYRARQDKDIIPPDPDRSHAANFLYMLHGDPPSEGETAAMNAALILYAEHGMNASTFAGTVTASTLANFYSALTSSIGALQGPLHGGATETVIDMLEEVGSADNAEDWVQTKLDNHEKIPGFGHRVYEVTDPRCAHFKHHIEQLMDEDDTAWLDTIEAVRDAVEERLGEKGIWPNTDLYSGTLYRKLDIPADFYTAIFALARFAGWSAHIIEQIKDNRIIRPRIRYTGDVDREWVPVDNR